MSDDHFKLLVETQRTTARIEQKVDFLIEQANDHENRLRAGERWRWGIPGVGVLSVLLALFGVAHS